MGRVETKKIQASHKVRNEIQKNVFKAFTKTKRRKDKKDRATIQNVFDQKTLTTLSRLQVNEHCGNLEVVISTGKEANVYLSRSPRTGKPLAVKVYKTMVTKFKDRAEYIEGDIRFRKVGKQVRTNPHKIVYLWAEKEYRNLKRMREVGIRCPEPLKLKDNILIMELLGREKVAFPRLRDVKIATGELSGIYLECLFLIRKMYQKVAILLIYFLMI